MQSQTELLLRIKELEAENSELREISELNRRISIKHQEKNIQYASKVSAIEGKVAIMESRASQFESTIKATIAERDRHQNKAFELEQRLIAMETDKTKYFVALEHSDIMNKLADQKQLIDNLNSFISRIQMAVDMSLEEFTKWRKSNEKTGNFKSADSSDNRKEWC